MESPAPVVFLNKSDGSFLDEAKNKTVRVQAPKNYSSHSYADIMVKMPV
jgi:hypothetical protein